MAYPIVLQALGLGVKYIDLRDRNIVAVSSLGTQAILTLPGLRDNTASKKTTT